MHAAAFINKNGGNVKLIIPAGRYVVGRQKPNIGHADYHHPVYEGEVVMSLLKVSNVSIIGTGNVKIIYKDSLRFGTFNVQTGKHLSDKNELNPFGKNSKNKSADYTATALTGDFLDLINCRNVEIKNLELDGNSGNYILGGTWGYGSNPIELANCYGIQLLNDMNITLEQLYIHHFGVDNLLLQSECEQGDTGRPLTKNILINRVRCDFSGRNGFSWTGGKNIAVCNSSFTNSGMGRIKTSPSYGMDIEPEGSPGKVLCVGGYFLNDIYEDNAGLGLTAGTSGDNPHFSGAVGYSYNHTFKNCIVSGRYSSALNNYINRVTFDGCKFYGNVLNYGSSLDKTPPAVFKNCYFSDKYKGEIFEGRKLLNMVLSYKLQVINCVFEKFSDKTDANASYIYEKDWDATTPCTDESIKTYMENCIFRYFPAPASAVVFACNGKRIIFRNNKFYKQKSNNIRWYNIPGCTPGEGTGCTDAGMGLQYLDMEK